MGKKPAGYWMLCAKTAEEKRERAESDLAAARAEIETHWRVRCDQLAAHRDRAERDLATALAALRGAGDVQGQLRAALDACESEYRKLCISSEAYDNLHSEQLAALRVQSAAATRLESFLEQWIHQMGAALKPPGADTFGAGMRDAKDQVARMIRAARTGTPTPARRARDVSQHVVPVEEWLELLTQRRSLEDRIEQLEADIDGVRRGQRMFVDEAVAFIAALEAELKYFEFDRDVPRVHIEKHLIAYKNGTVKLHAQVEHAHLAVELCEAAVEYDAADAEDTGTLRLGYARRQDARKRLSELAKAWRAAKKGT